MKQISRIRLIWNFCIQFQIPNKYYLFRLSIAMPKRGTNTFKDEWLQDERFNDWLLKNPQSLQNVNGVEIA